MISLAALTTSISAVAAAADQGSDEPSSEMEAAPAVVHIADPAGDANGVNGQDALGPEAPISSPVSHSAADLRSVAFQTTYVMLRVGDNGIDYQPTGLRIHLRTEGPPRTLGPSLLFRLSTRIGASCQSYLQGTIRGTASTPVDPADGKVEWVRRDGSCPGGSGTFSESTWKADVSGNSVILSFPFSSLDAAQLGILGEGSSLSSPKAGTRTVFGSAAAPQLDETAVGGQWVIGSDMPPDVPCTKRCP
ncbi:MAG TPA: hypothetical protein VEA19_07085 [Actinomycetota bacterium]|nr:hypothetical protein [Actinomycetota bacterium]